jgi:hypothetical protein
MYSQPKSYKQLMPVLLLGDCGSQVHETFLHLIRLDVVDHLQSFIVQPKQ